MFRFWDRMRNHYNTFEDYCAQLRTRHKQDNNITVGRPEENAESPVETLASYQKKKKPYIRQSVKAAWHVASCEEQKLQQLPHTGETSSVGKVLLNVAVVLSTVWKDHWYKPPVRKKCTNIRCTNLLQKSDYWFVTHWSHSHSRLLAPKRMTSCLA